MQVQSNPILPQVPRTEDITNPEYMQIFCKNLIQVLRDLHRNIVDDVNQLADINSLQKP